MPQYTQFYNLLDSEVQRQELHVSTQDLRVNRNSQLIDVSTGLDENICMLSYSKPSETEEEKIKQLDRQKKEFVKSLLELNEDNVDTNWAFLFMQESLKKNKVYFLHWLLALFVSNQTDEGFMLKLLELLINFSYEEVTPEADSIAIACKGMRYLSVQSKNLSLLGHWCNQPALDILNNYEEPQNNWMRIKYQRLKEVISDYVLRSQNRGTLVE